jgi:hypothetical protein
MSFAVRNLSVLAYASGFTLWHYRAEREDGSRSAEPGFFDEAGDMIASGDMVLVSSETGGRILSMVQGTAGIQAVPLA